MNRRILNSTYGGVRGRRIKNNYPAPTRLDPDQLFLFAAGNVHIVLLTILQGCDRTGFIFIAVVHAFLLLVLGNHHMAGDCIDVMVDFLLIPEEAVIVRQVVNVLQHFLVCRQLNLLTEDLAYIILSVVELQQFGEGAVGDHLLPIFIFMLGQQFLGPVQLGNFLLQMHFPD